MPKNRIDAMELEKLEPVMVQAKNACIARHISFDDMLSLFDEEVHGKIRGAALADGVTHVVCFENLDLWSSHGGDRTAMVVGTQQSYPLAKVLQTPYFRLGGVPSRFQYPVAYASIEPLRAAQHELAIVDGAEVQAAAVLAEIAAEEKSEADAYKGQGGSFGGAGASGTFDAPGPSSPAPDLGSCGPDSSDTGGSGGSTE